MARSRQSITLRKWPQPDHESGNRGLVATRRLGPFIHSSRPELARRAGTTGDHTDLHVIDPVTDHRRLDVLATLALLPCSTGRSYGPTD